MPSSGQTNGKGTGFASNKTTAYISPEDKETLAFFWHKKAKEALDLAGWCEMAYEAELRIGNANKEHLEFLKQKWKTQLQIAREAEMIAEELLRGNGESEENA